MSESLEEHFKSNQKYLQLGDKESWTGAYISWQPTKTRFGKDAYKFTLERSDGSRLEWDTGNNKAIMQMISLKLSKGDQIKIYREGTEKDNTKYTITKVNPDEERLPF